MPLSAAVTTSKGVGAISSIQLTADEPALLAEIAGKIFRSSGGKAAEIEPGRILVGDIVDGGRSIDHVVLGCESETAVAINCHGNPLIVEMIMKLLRKNGAELVEAEQLLTQRFVAGSLNAIEAEGKIAQLKSVTIEGAKLIANQMRGGLTSVINEWLGAGESLDIAGVTGRCREILDASKAAGLIINGCKVVLAGPPNSGKSTLLNTLAGKQKAIVTEIAGTTRDWVSATCRTKSLLIEFIDTAGLDENIATEAVDKESQERSAEQLRRCDLVLMVIDGSLAAVEQELVGLADRTIAVFNKSDLGAETNEADVGGDFTASVRISAKDAVGIEELMAAIREVSGVTDFDWAKPVCFTERQRKLVGEISRAKTKQEIKELALQLLA